MKKFLIKVSTWAFVFLVFWFLSLSLIDNWQAVINFNFSFNWFYLAIAFLLLCFSFLILPMVWRGILLKLNKANYLSRKQAIKIYFTAELSKYAPGKVWNILGMVYMASKRGLNKQDLLFASVLESVLSTIIILIVGVVFTALFVGVEVLSKWVYLFAFLAVLAGVVLCLPQVFYRFLNVVLKILKKDVVINKKILGGSFIFKLSFYYLLFSLGFGAAFFFFIKSFIPINFNILLDVVGIFCLSAGLGTVALFSPAGLGVREGVLAILLLPFFSLPTATIIIFSSRIFMTLTELFLFAIFYLYAKLKQ